jgi:ribonuclease G
MYLKPNDGASMAEQIIVNVKPYETRTALLEDGLVTETFIERTRDVGIVGNIYLGVVQRVLPGMQAAFVEIGLERAGFLYVGDVAPPDVGSKPHPVPPPSSKKAGRASTLVDFQILENPEKHKEPATGSQEAAEKGQNGEQKDGDTLSESTRLSDVVKKDPSAVEGSQQKSGDVPEPVKKKTRKPIQELLKQGQKVLVQVSKDAIGTKGPRLTCNISLPGRHLVYMPTHHHLGISRKIEEAEERERLRKILEESRPEEGGFVVRTVSEGVSEDMIKADLHFLVSLWEDIKTRSLQLSPPGLVQPELNLAMKTARDAFGSEVSRFIIDNRQVYEEIRDFIQRLDPRLEERLELYADDEPVFERYEVETELARAMGRKVWLKSGGSLIIDQAEALTVVDINTGKFVGRRNLEDTILRTNLEAVTEIAYQLRLRNIGGMVIIDFIDMEVATHRDRVWRELEIALSKDRARCNLVRMSELGLVELSRQRRQESLGRQLHETCWYCDGLGSLKSKRTMAYEIFRNLGRHAPRLSEPVVVIHAHPEVVDEIQKRESAVLQFLEETSGKRILIRPRGSFHQEQFDIFGMSEEAVLQKNGSSK